MLPGGKICAVVADEGQRMEEEEGMQRLWTRLVFNLCTLPSPYMLISVWSRSFHCLNKLLVNCPSLTLKGGKNVYWIKVCAPFLQCHNELCAAKNLSQVVHEKRNGSSSTRIDERIQNAKLVQELVEDRNKFKKNYNSLMDDVDKFMKDTEKRVMEENLKKMNEEKNQIFDLTRPELEAEASCLPALRYPSILGVILRRLPNLVVPDASVDLGAEKGLALVVLLLLELLQEELLLEELLVHWKYELLEELLELPLVHWQ
ncbi:hypothetical protein ACQ4PT_008848 [Festuca glaucescens]